MPGLLESWGSSSMRPVPFMGLILRHDWAALLVLLNPQIDIPPWSVQYAGPTVSASGWQDRTMITLAGTTRKRADGSGRLRALRAPCRGRRQAEARLDCDPPRDGDRRRPVHAVSLARR